MLRRIHTWAAAGFVALVLIAPADATEANALAISAIAAHFYRTLTKDYLSSMGDNIGIARMLDIDYPGRTFVVIPIGALNQRAGDSILSREEATTESGENSSLTRERRPLEVAVRSETR